MRIVLKGWLVSVETRRVDHRAPSQRIAVIQATPNGNNVEPTRVEVEVPDTFEWCEFQDRRLRVVIEADE